MKVLFLLLFPITLFGQTIKCTFKADDYFMWKPADVTIKFTHNSIEVIEVEGVKLIVDYDEKLLQPNGATFYSYKTSVRAMEPPIRVEGNRVYSVLKNNYICPENN